MSTDRLSATFQALADPTRRAILARLALGETSVSELAEPFDISGPAISRHLKVLEHAGLIARGREAQWRPCRIELNALKGVDDWLEEYRRLWEQRLDRLEDYLRTLQIGVAAEPKPTEKAGEEAWPQKVASTWSQDPKVIDRLRGCSTRRASWCGRCGPIPSIWRNGGARTASRTTTSAFDFRPAASGASSCTARTAATTRTASPSTRS